jgi:L-amino acid N-acyltransferase YncA
VTRTEAAVRLRDAGPGDLPHIQAIYAHHVRNGLASFEETAPDLAEIRRRFEATLAQGFPYIAAEITSTGGQPLLVGYAYAGAYRARPAYRYSVENSVYIAPDCLGRGVGRRLLAELIGRCTAQGFRQMIAVIGDSDNAASIGLHKALGFSPAGRLTSVGFKFGRWVDSVIMQRPLGAGDGDVPGVPPGVNWA